MVLGCHWDIIYIKYIISEVHKTFLFISSKSRKLTILYTDTYICHGISSEPNHPL